MDHYYINIKDIYTNGHFFQVFLLVVRGSMAAVRKTKQKKA